MIGTDHSRASKEAFMNLADATHKHFKKTIGDRLLVDAKGVDCVELTSIEVKPSHEGTKRRPFVLTFRGSVDVQLPQSIYTLNHKKLGKLEIFLVPVAQDKKYVHYEAVFN